MEVTCVSCKQKLPMSLLTFYDWMKEGEGICSDCSSMILKKYIRHTAEGSALSLILLTQKVNHIHNNLMGSVEAHKKAMAEALAEVEDMVDIMEAENQQLHQRAEDAEIALKEK